MITTMALALLQQPPQHVEMTAGGWVFMILAWIMILGLTFFTFSRVLGNRR
jgi:hypothetical protein